MRGKQVSTPRQWRSSRLGGTLATLALAAILPVLAIAWCAANHGGAPSVAADPIGQRAYPPATQQVALPHHRVYSVVKQGQHFVLMAADAGGVAKPVTPLPDGFGSADTDTVAALALSANQQFLAIDAQRDHGDTVWVVSTTDAQLRLIPNDATGNFLHWLPDGEHFLFRPYLPTRASDAAWNPGLWIVDAGTGTHVNLALPGNLPATDLIDAAPAPDGARIVLSVTVGLGQGSRVWMASPDGLQMQPLLQSRADVGLFAWSPDGQQIAYETIADSSLPFQPAGLWVMTAQGQTSRELATADGGHGYAPAWSPDGARLAFVARLNPSDTTANANAGALISAVQVATLADGRITTIAAPAQTGQPRNITPQWQPDGTLLFTAMAASGGYGAASGPSALWQATTPQAGAKTDTMRLAPLNAQGYSSATVFITLVP